MKKIIERIETLKNSVREDRQKEQVLENIYNAKIELENAFSNFNEAVGSDYIDVAIFNLNLAKKRYELSLLEAKGSWQQNDIAIAR